MGTMTMDSFTRQYIVTALWSSTTGDDAGTPLDRDYSEDDIAPKSLERMVEDCAKFQEQCAEWITDENLLVNPDHDTDGRAGHDFWLTRNGHGAGFWDGDWEEPAATKLDEASKAFGECELYVGDDGKIYVYGVNA